jgi:sarcosine oxidase
VLEQAEIGHAGAGSKGSCRIFRLGYPDPDYVSAARRARSCWDELALQTGRTILLPTPHLTFGPHLSAVHDAMRRAGAPCELLATAAVAERFPQISVGGPALLETRSCVIAVEPALAALAEAAGLADPAADRLRTGIRVTGIADDGRQVTLQTSGGTVTARLAIVTAGPWTAGLLAGQLDLPTTATLEQVGYLAPARTQDEVPIFICHGDQSPYGLPVPGSDRYKIGIHLSGPVVSPDAQDHAPDQAMVDRLTEVAARYLPGYQPEPVATERCVYDNTSDEDFIMDRVGNVVIGCGTSGHGFKFGPLYGEWLAGLAGLGPDVLAADGLVSKFSLARIEADSAREPR